jgi:mannose-6-phosphate isomerase-like protein (cupin superfamily)
MAQIKGAFCAFISYLSIRDRCFIFYKEDCVQRTQLCFNSINLMKRTMIVFGWIVLFYVVVICGLFRLLGVRDTSGHPAIVAGGQLRSEVEGFTFQLLEVTKDYVRTRIGLAPFSAGPPMHYHRGMDEVFHVTSGEVVVEVGGIGHHLSAGESISVPAYTPHRIYNAGSAPAEVLDHRPGSDDPGMPRRFCEGLAYLYMTMDRAGSADSPAVLMELARQGPALDTWLAGTPFVAQISIRWILGPVSVFF